MMVLGWRRHVHDLPPPQRSTTPPEPFKHRPERWLEEGETAEMTTATRKKLRQGTRHDVIKYIRSRLVTSSPDGLDLTFGQRGDIFYDRE